MGNQLMGIRVVACILCLIVIATSVDTIPDPPAIQPQTDQHILVPRLVCSPTVAVENHALDYLAWASVFRCNLFSFGQIFEGTTPSYEPAFFRQATDSSPPLFS